MRPLYTEVAICFSKVKTLSIVMPINFALERPSITELLILMDFTLKGDKNKFQKRINSFQKCAPTVIGCGVVCVIREV